MKAVKQGLPKYLQMVLDKYDVELHDIAENYNKNKIWIFESSRGRIMLQRYYGSGKDLWLAYNVFKTLVGNDVLHVVEWYTTKEGAPFVEYGNQLYYLTQSYEAKQFIDNEIDTQFLFLAKWHFLSREIVYAKDFADSIAAPRPFTTMIKLVELEGQAAQLRDNILDYIKKQNVEDMQEKCLAITLPQYHTKRLVKLNDKVVFQPWKQVFIWGWQILDLADLICLQINSSQEQFTAALKEYQRLNPLSVIEWKLIPALILWKLCIDENYTQVCTEYYELYQKLIAAIAENGVNITDIILLPSDDSTSGEEWDEECEDDPEDEDLEKRGGKLIIKPVNEFDSGITTDAEILVTSADIEDVGIQKGNDAKSLKTVDEVELSEPSKDALSPLEVGLEFQDDSIGEESDNTIRSTTLQWKPFPPSPWENH